MPTIWDVLLQASPYILTVIVTLIGLIVFRFSRLGKLARLLGIDRRARRVVLYLSSLLVPRGSAVDFRGQARSYQGITIPSEEFAAGVALSKLLPTDPFENLPPIVRRPLGERYPFFKPIQIDVNASPMRDIDIDFSTRSIIALGGPGYNIVSDYCSRNNLCQLAFTANGTQIAILQGKGRGETITPPSPQYDIAMLEKVVDSSRDNSTIVLAAGLGVTGTMGAANYLLKNWHKLEREHGKKQFALVLQFGPFDKLPLAEALRGTVVRSLPGD
jgi:hypothetical protein